MTLTRISSLIDKPSFRVRAILSLLILFSVCRICAQPRNEIPYILLVSFDGFRSDYIDRYKLPNFQALAEQGSSAEGLIPVFPSKTFPNHYSIVTGLYAGNHGLVDNQFFDPKSNRTYRMKDRDAVKDTMFYGGKPLWTLCRENGVKSASFFWVGSEVRDEASRPNYYYAYNESISNEERIQQVIDWLKLPEKERPHFITLYFSSPDSEGHATGPLSETVQMRLMELDTLLGDLIGKVNKTALPVNIIVVSDHGMYELKHREETYIPLPDYLENAAAIRLVNSGTLCHLYTQKTDSAYAQLKKTEDHFKVYRAEELPQHWHYKNPRAGNIILEAEPGYIFVNKSKEETLKQRPLGSSFGVHGYDAQKCPEMYGIFYAKGPDIKKGKKIAAFENIHIYPLIATLLKLPLPYIDGDPKVLRSIINNR